MNKKKPTPFPARLALWMGAFFFRKIQQPRLHAAHPDWPGCRSLQAVSRDGRQIRGWWCPAKPDPLRKGTIILVHGITIHSFHYLNMAEYLSRETGLGVAACDLRFHGLSEDGAITFGAAEAWDVRAFLDGLERAGASRPFIVIGDSLGGLATQRATVEDPRIDGAILMQTPGWPWNAITRTAKKLGGLARFINHDYDYDILADGDLRNYRAPTIHRPPVFYVVGDRDFYDWHATQEIYDWWQTENAGGLEETPLTSPERSRWLTLVEGAEHDNGKPDCYNVWRWPLIWPNIIAFIEIVCVRAQTPKQ